MFTLYFMFYAWPQKFLSCTLSIKWCNFRTFRRICEQGSSSNFDIYFSTHNIFKWFNLNMKIWLDVVYKICYGSNSEVKWRRYDRLKSGVSARTEHSFQIWMMHDMVHSRRPGKTFCRYWIVWSNRPIFHIIYECPGPPAKVPVFMNVC